MWFYRFNFLTNSLNCEYYNNITKGDDNGGGGVQLYDEVRGHAQGDHDGTLTYTATNTILFFAGSV